MKHTGYLVVSASGEMRIVKRPRTRWLRLDEVAYKVSVVVPDGWATVRGEIEVTMPEPPDGAVLEEDAEA